MSSTKLEEEEEKKVNWHALPRSKALQKLGTTEKGLTDDEVKERLSTHGYNEIREEKAKSPVVMFLKQFTEPLIIILLVATVLSGFIGEIIDSIVIIAIVILSTVVGFVQEYRSEKAIAELKRMAALKTTVVRNGNEKEVDARELVPGDIILVSVGDRIPADALILESHGLKTDESSLTGESIPVEKSPAELPEDTPLADRKNILYTVTTVTSGRGRAVVFATAMNTELGHIAGRVQAIETKKTPFEKRIRHLGKMLSILMMITVGIITVIGLLQGHSILDMIVWGISLAVAAVPEALPAVVAASLTIGVYRMAKRNAIVRRLPAVETLGSTTIICSDKTGTLTKGQMTVQRIYIYDKTSEVTGVGYSPDGKIKDFEKDDERLLLLARCAMLCNDARIHLDDGNYSVTGDPTEGALIVFAQKAGLGNKALNDKFPRVSEIQFTSERKRMSTIHEVNDSHIVFSKGATETILERCSQIVSTDKGKKLDRETKAKILEVNDAMASDGFRVLALAYKELVGDDFSEENVEKDLIFIGLVGMIDPPREEALHSVSQCNDAGINVVMITGDHKLTAEAVAQKIGILRENDHDSRSTSGQELEKLEVSELERRVEDIKVYSRVSPEHKIKIVEALKKRGHVVAMTGDGINDAAALKGADIGVAMGIAGTQVTKEASSIILSDDNFASIVSAVKEGRRIMDNVKKYLIYLLPVNIGEIILFAFSIVMGWPLPLLAKHILYINLATDGSPAIALGMEPAEPDIMKRKPRDPKESIFSNTLQWFVGVSIIIAAVSIFQFWYILEINGWTEFAVNKARTMLFGLLVFEEIIFALSCRSLLHTPHAVGLFRNKFLIYSLIGESSMILFIMNHPAMIGIFDLVSIGITDWLLIFSLAILTFAYSEILKAFRRRKLAAKQKASAMNEITN